MSEPSNSAEAQGLTLPADPTSAFGAMLEFLAPEADAAEADQGAPPDPAAGDVPGQQPAEAEGTGAAAGSAGAPAAGDGGEPAAAGAGAAAAGTDGGAAPEVAAVTSGIDAETLAPKFGAMATGFEARQTAALEREALAAVQQEYSKYFDALREHPRMLVGREVPSLNGPGTEKLRDSTDAKEWQDAVKQILVSETASRVEKQREDLADVYATVHSSIDMFRNNLDLIPGTKQFDKELADAFAKAASDYELKADGKLVGYSVPVQPIINAIRSQLATGRGGATATAAAAAAATQSARQQQAADQARTPTGQFDGPQAGLSSKAGQSSSGEDDLAAGVLSSFFRQNGLTL